MQKNYVRRRMLLCYDQLQRIAFSIFPGKQLGKNWLTKHLLFHRLLLASADPKSLFQRRDTERYPGVCAAAAILLKNRDKGMSLVPYVISTILKVGRTSKKVSAVTFEFCLSP